MNATPDLDRLPSLSSLSNEDFGLLTDLYQLTMTACYVGESLARTVAICEKATKRLWVSGRYGLGTSVRISRSIAV
jgi:hypothetical protein